MGQTSSASHSEASNNGTCAPSTQGETSGDRQIQLDIAQMILDALDFDDLKSVSLVSSCMYKFVNTRLWRSTRITDRGLPNKPGRQALLECCRVILRDPARASSIRTLGISWCYSLESGTLAQLQDDCPLSLIGQVFAILPNLTTLKIHFEPSQGNQLVGVLLQNRHTFRLKCLELGAMPTVGLLKFLEAQPSIEEYRVRDPRSRSVRMNAGPELPLTLPVRVLPALKKFWFSGHSDCLRDTIAGRTLQCVETSPGGIKRDIDRLFDDGFSEETGASPNDVDEDAKASVNHMCVHLWGAGDGIQHFPDVISIVYRISLSTIKSLKIDSWDTSLYEAVASSLNRFPLLENLECWGGPDPSAESCARHARFAKIAVQAAPALKRIMISIGAQGKGKTVQVYYPSRRMPCPLKGVTGPDLPSPAQMRGMDLRDSEVLGPFEIEHEWVKETYVIKNFAPFPPNVLAPTTPRWPF